MSGKCTHTCLVGTNKTNRTNNPSPPPDQEQRRWIFIAWIIADPAFGQRSSILLLVFALSQGQKIFRKVLKIPGLLGFSGHGMLNNPPLSMA